MIVFGFYGRSGQGVSTAVKVFSKACLLSGFQVQSFTFAGQRGFPVKGFVKIDKNPIESRQEEVPDFYVLFETLGMDHKSFKDGSVVIFNSPEKLVFAQLKKRKVRAYFVDATEIAFTNLKTNMPNTAMLGALTKIFNKVSIKSIRASMDLPRENVNAFDEGYKTVR